MIKISRSVQPDGSFVETSTQEQSSVVIKRNAKGEYAWDLKVYKDDPSKFKETAEEFLNRIGEVISIATNANL